MTFVLVHVRHRKKFEGRMRKLSPVRHQTCIIPSRNNEPSSELHWFVRGVCPNVRQIWQLFTTSSWWHDITSTKVSCFSVHFFIFGIKMQCHSLFAPLYLCAGSRSPTPLATLGGAKEAKPQDNQSNAKPETRRAKG